MPTDVVTKPALPHGRVLVIPVEGAALAPKVGDKVAKQPILDDSEDVSFYRIKKVAGDVFETDPNSPFEKGWKGKVSNFKPHATYPGYWVPVVQGTMARAALASMAKPQPKNYEVGLNWHGETHTTRVIAYSESQAYLRASKQLASKELSAYTAWHIHNYIKQNPARVSLKPI